MASDATLRTGRNCLCGSPIVIRGNRPWCPVCGQRHNWTRANRHELPPIGVGRDCDCGHPMIWWHNDEQRCSVYGRHLPNPEPLTHWWNRDAPGAQLVADLDKIPLPPGLKRTRNADYRGPW